MTVSSSASICHSGISMVQAQSGQGIIALTFDKTVGLTVEPQRLSRSISRNFPKKVIMVTVNKLNNQTFCLPVQGRPDEKFARAFCQVDIGPCICEETGSRIGSAFLEKYSSRSGTQGSRAARYLIRELATGVAEAHTLCAGTQSLPSQGQQPRIVSQNRQMTKRGAKPGILLKAGSEATV